jgi:hypothetical protein
MRRSIAALAARLMAEVGIADYGLAKRTAARQLGAPETDELPNNAEIEAELRPTRRSIRKTNSANACWKCAGRQPKSCVCWILSSLI